jgi:hypothetical protein
MVQNGQIEHFNLEYAVASAAHTCCPFNTSHMTTVLSSEPDMTKRPSRDQHTLTTALLHKQM